MFIKILKDSDIELHQLESTGKLVTCKKIKLDNFNKDIINILTLLKNNDFASTLIYYKKENNNIKLFLNYIEGEDCFDYVIRKGALSEEKAKDIFIQLVDLISEVHLLGYIHRDIKLENIIIKPDGKIVLIDWDFAGRWSKDIYLNMQCGSLECAAPEILSGRSYIGPEVDIYSMGVILFELLTNKEPFRICRKNLIFYRSNPLLIPDFLNDNIKELLKGMLCSRRQRWNMKQIQSCKWLKKTK